MSGENSGNQWKTLDKDLNKISQVEYATQLVARPLVGMGVALAFIVVAALGAAVFFGQTPTSLGRRHCCRVWRLHGPEHRCE